MTDQTDPRCAKCGHKLSEHHYRHKFVGPTKDETLRALAAERDHYKARAEAAEAALREIEEDCKLRADPTGLVPIGRTAWIMLTNALAQIDADPTEPGPTLADAYRAGLEAAAKECETTFAVNPFRYELGTGCARAIRALKVPPEFGGE